MVQGFPIFKSIFMLLIHNTCAKHRTSCITVSTNETGAMVPTLKSCRADIERKKEGEWSAAEVTIDLLQVNHVGVWQRKKWSCHQGFKGTVVWPHFSFEVIICVISPTPSSTAFPCNLFSTLAAQQPTDLPKINTALSAAVLAAIHTGH